MEDKKQSFAPKISRCDYGGAVTELSEPILCRENLWQRLVFELETRTYS